MFLKLLNKHLWLVSESFLLFLAVTVPTQAKMVDPRTLSLSNFPNSCSPTRKNFSSLSTFSLAQGEASINIDSKKQSAQALNVSFNSNNEQNIQSQLLASMTGVCDCVIYGLPGRWIWVGGRHLCRICPVPY